MEKHGYDRNLDIFENENHGKCSICNYDFENEDTAYIGYGKDKEPIYACSACKSRVENLMVKRSYSKSAYEKPSLDSKLWRYMDFTKFVSLLFNDGLYFCRADIFEDPFEGAKGVKANEQKWDTHYKKFFYEAVTNPPEGYEMEKTEEEAQADVERLLKNMKNFGITDRKTTFINCWHENNHESEAMWRLYSKSFENAVAIQTTYGLLYHSINKEPSISIGRVKYIDYQKKYAGVNESFWRKRKSFEHEKEVRAVICDRKNNNEGRIIECDFDVLIENIYVSPCAPHWFYDLIKDVISKYGHEFPVKQSKLSDEPFY
jgi:uncharacterized protein YlaI